MKRDNSARFAETIAPTPDLGEEQRWKALRAVTAAAMREGWDPHGDAPLPPLWREVVFSLGLVGVEERTGESEPVEREALLAAVNYPDRVVRCPDCHALPGAPCTVMDGTRAYTRGHIARHRKAEERA